MVTQKKTTYILTDDEIRTVLRQYFLQEVGSSKIPHISEKEIQIKKDGLGLFTAEYTTIEV